MANLYLFMKRLLDYIILPAVIILCEMPQVGVSNDMKKFEPSTYSKRNVAVQAAPEVEFEVVDVGINEMNIENRNAFNRLITRNFYEKQ